MEASGSSRSRPRGAVRPGAARRRARAAGLLWRRLGGRTAGRLLTPLVHGLRAVHSGLIGDYVTWLTVGTAVIGAVCVLELR